MKYTVLLQQPDEITEGSTPFEDTYLAHVVADNPQAAAKIARQRAAQAHDWVDQLSAYAVLAIFEGHHRDHATGSE